MTTYVIKCQLIAYDKDFCGYITYVFKNLEENPEFGKEYMMVTRVPNWDHKPIELNEKGYMTCKEIIAGKDTWYNTVTEEFIPYKYTNIYFIKFVKEGDSSSKDILI